MEITSDRLHIKIAGEFLKQYLENKPQKMKLLDVGSADNIIKSFLPENVTYYSLELPPEEQDEELRKDKHDFVLDLDKDKIPVKYSFFDIIVCLDVIEHTLIPQKVLEEIKRVSKKDALFIISVPNEYNFLQRIYYLFAIKTRGETPWKVVEMHQHVQKPRVKDILELLSENFRKCEVRYLWASRTSNKNSFFKFVDKIINFLAKIYPSLFAINVIASCEGKKTFNTPKNLFNLEDRNDYC